MSIWVDRIAKKQTDFRKELEELRRKYEREEQPPEDFPRGFRESGFQKFESLFPEFREWEKTLKPTVSPEMAFQPYAEAPIVNPFREAPPRKYPQPMMHLPPKREPEYILSPEEYKLPEGLKGQRWAKQFELSARGLTREEFGTVIDEWRQRQETKGNMPAMIESAQNAVRYGLAESVEQYLESELGDQAAVRLLELPHNLAHKVSDRYSGKDRGPLTGTQGFFEEQEPIKRPTPFMHLPPEKPEPPLKFPDIPEEGSELEQGLTLMPSGEVMSKDVSFPVGHLDPETGEFSKSWQVHGLTALEKPLKVLEAALTPFRMVGQALRGMVVAPELTEADRTELERRTQEIMDKYDYPRQMAYELALGAIQTAEFKERPMWEQLLWELPAWGGLAKTGLSALRGWRAAAKLPTALEIPAKVALAPVVGVEAVAGVGLKYGVVIPVKYAVKGVSKATLKSFEMALDTGLDKWLAFQGRTRPEIRTWWANFIIKDRNWLIERATQNMLKRQAEARAKKQGLKFAETQAVKDTIRDVEVRLLEAPAEVVKPPAVKAPEAEVARLAEELKAKLAAEPPVTKPPVVEAPTKTPIVKPVPQQKVMPPDIVETRVEVVSSINDELYTPIAESPLDVASSSYFKDGDFDKFVKLLPEVRELKLEALGDEVIANIDALTNWWKKAGEQIDRGYFETLFLKVKSGKKLTVDEATRLGIALRTTGAGKLVPSIRQSGFYVTEDFANYPSFKDVGYVSGKAMDTMTMFEAIDGGFATGATQKQILYPAMRTRLAKDNFSDIYVFRYKDIMEKLDMVGNKKLRQVAGDVLEHINAAEADFKTAQLLSKPEIKNLVKGYSKPTQAKIVEFAQATRAFFDDLIAKQNLARAKRGQPVIPYRNNYRPWVAETNVWSKLGFQKKTPADFMQEPPLPDYIKPDAPFNARAMAREGGMTAYELERDLMRLTLDYINTAAKDIFNTSVVQNTKAHIGTLRSMGYPNSARLIEDWVSEVYAGVLPQVEKGIRGIVPSQVLKPMWLLRRNLTRAVFPLNWMWNVTVQTSSIAFTVTRYGIRNTLRGLDYLFDSSAQKQVRSSYSWIVKSKRAGKMVYQDVGEQVQRNLAVEGSLIDKAEHLANALTSFLEEKLTGISIRAALFDGLNLGYKGRELLEFASKGGAKTQSMYNLEDVPGVLRSKTITSAFPFQTFCFQAMNTIREMNIVFIRRGIGRAGAYESMSAKSATGKATISKRIKMILEFIATMWAINVTVDMATGRKPWRVSSFIPMYSNIVVGMDSTNEWNLPLSLQYVAEFKNAFDAVMKYDNWEKMRRWAIRYHMLGGTQVNRMVNGVIAVIHGEVTDTRGKRLFEVKPEEWLKAVMMGPYRTEGGEAYVDEIKKSKGKFYEFTGIPLPARANIKKELDKAHAQLGQTDDEGNIYTLANYARMVSTLKSKAGIDRMNKDALPLALDYLNTEELWSDYFDLPIGDARDEYRQAHPDIEASMFFWGHFTVLRNEDSRPIVLAMMKKYNIPDKAVPALAKVTKAKGIPSGVINPFRD